MAEYYDPETYPTQWNYLQSGTIIDQYIIERELAHGGFSSVYLARQMSDQIQVAIKEYLPRKFAHRSWNNVVVANDDENKSVFFHGRALFFEEAKVLATLKHPNIVNVINFFNANETVYMVMQYDYGLTLDRLMRRNRDLIDGDFLAKIFDKLLQGLEAVHAHGLIHLDVKPANILVRAEHDPLLLDFGASRKFPAAPSNGRSKILTPGFSPIEQHDRKGELGPWSDIYALGASLRSFLDSKIPPPAIDRLSQDNLQPASKVYRRKFPEYLLNAIDWTMMLDPAQRPQSVAELQQKLSQSQ